MYRLTAILITTLILVSTGCEFKDFFEAKEFDEIISHVSADADSANIVVSTTDSPETTVEVDIEYWGREPDFDAWIDGTTLRIELDCHPSCHGDVLLLVPQAVSLDADTGSGNVGVSDIEGSIKASTGSGNISIENAFGDLDLETGSGNITGTNLVSNNCYADTGSGNVKLSYDEIPSDIDMGTGSGNIKLSVPYGSYDVQLDTGSGNTSIEGLVDDPGSPNVIRGDTGSGNIAIQGYW